jgi:hypothetical protein
MEHTEAVRLQAAEKYLLGELTEPQRAEYEEHYFDCHDCAEELKATVAFMESAKHVAREDAPPALDEKKYVAAGARWFAWLRPVFAVPAFAALILFAGYQGVMIARLKNAAPAQMMTASVQLLGSIRGGGEDGGDTAKVRVRAGEGFLLNFDFTPSKSFASYQWQVQDQSGVVVQKGTIAGDNANQGLHLPVTGGVQRAGKYYLVFFGIAENGDARGGTEVQRLAFAVEFKQ